MPDSLIVAHYHELWLKGRNRSFFLAKLVDALRRALDGLEVVRIRRPGDRVTIELNNAAHLDEALRRLARVSGVAYYAVARPVERALEAICAASWEEMRGEQFATFAVRAKRSDKSFPHNAAEIERIVGRVLLDKLREAHRDVRVNLSAPDITCHIEIPPGPSALVYARRIPGAGGLPANTAGRLLCLLSGGFDSAVAAWKLMKRGAHVDFAHFYGTGARPGESSVHVARELARTLTPWQFTSRLFLVPFDGLQRDIAARAPEPLRVLLYRRLMLRIAERLALRNRALGLVCGDSLGQVASQTLLNMAAVGAAARLPLYRPLAGDDKQEILAVARRIGTYEISAEPFHDCCPVFLPKAPALFASAGELDAAEAALDLDALIRRGISEARMERFAYVAGRVEQVAAPRETVKSDT
jgi:thiamine biosynthesis protein ThiI